MITAVTCAAGGKNTAVKGALSFSSLNRPSGRTSKAVNNVAISMTGDGCCERTGPVKKKMANMQAGQWIRTVFSKVLFGQP